MSSNDPGAGTRVTDSLLTAVTELLDTPLTPLSDDALIAAMRTLERCSRMLAAVATNTVVETTQRCLPADLGAGTPKRFLMQCLGLSHQEAARRIATADTLGTWHTAGQACPPKLPHTATAHTAGDISADNAARVAAVMKRVPHHTEPEHRDAAERILVDLARTGSPDDIGDVGARILGHLDPDGTLADDKDRARMRGITVGPQRPDGMSPISGEITPTLRALLDAVLAKYARPGMNNPDDPESPTGDCDYIDRESMVAAATRDTRTAAQRTHDGLQALLRHGISAHDLGSHRGVPVSAILTMSISELEKMAGVATTATGGTVPISEALKLAEHGFPFLAVFDSQGLPLHFARTKRLASPAQRMALIASLRGCTRPGCDAPASLCATHHVKDWSNGGNTDIENETLACDRCHALIHNGRGGWKTLALSKNSQHPGRTAWIAPPHIDPTQTPRINHRHHPAELLAQTLARIYHHDELHPRQHQQQRSTPRSVDDRTGAEDEAA
ncbi:HNH endonuclease [Nocardia sp. NBC_00565]|uniref:HNH endonuclease signature motif containing protein n=1 Tax=Nocardia sp. NBC_00565 TaxID=2975993 RepID=UPI002E824612|nr:DUF222 domain-containing protein [Nocardia sp. NBC_00565]WUC05757.1 HNH endonuclease [Nocardia sp. NBC_00565]